MFKQDIKSIIVSFLIFLVLTIIFFNVISIEVKAADENIIFTEIMYDLPGSDENKEWVVILNTTSSNININSDWRFYDGDSHIIRIYQGDDILEPNEKAIIVDDGEQFLIDNPNCEFTILDSVVELPNEYGEIKLSLDKGEGWITLANYNDSFGAGGNGLSLQYIDGVWVEGEITIINNLNEEETEPEKRAICYCDTGEEVNENDQTQPEEYVEENNQNNNNNNNNNSANDIVDNDIDTNTSAPIVEKYSDKIIINEILPDPDGSDEEGEFIELFNMDEIEIDLKDWYLSDGTKEYKLDEVVEAGAYLAVYRAVSKISLNNSGGDIVTIFNPNNEIVYQIAYDKSLANKSYSYNSEINEWQWTDIITPSSINQFVTVEEDEGVIDNIDEQIDKLAEAEVALSLTDSTKEFGWQSISEVKDLEINTEVYLRGVVTVEPNILVSTYFYISEISDDNIITPELGIQIYCAKKDFPTLQVGDVVYIKGVLSQTGGEKRIKVIGQESIVIDGHEELPNIDILATGMISDDYEGGLVIVQGDLVDKKSSSWYLDDDSGEVRIYIATKADIEKPTVEVGQQIMIKGIVSETKSGFRILPRFTSDIIVEHKIEDNEPVIEQKIKVIAKSSENIVDLSNEDTEKPDDYLGYGIGVIGVSAISLFLRLKFL